MSLLNELQGFDVDIQDGLKRFVNNAALYEKMLKKFPGASADLPVLPHFEAGDLEAALANAHTLKGMTGNLSLTPLYKAYTDIVALLRAGEPDQARELAAQIAPVQAEISECIKKFM